MQTYDSSNEEGPLEGVNFGGVLGRDLLHLVKQVGRLVELEEEKHEPEVDADAAEHRAEVAAAEVELLLRSKIAHILKLINYYNLSN